MHPGHRTPLVALCAVILATGHAHAQQTVSEIAFEGLRNVSEDVIRMAVRTKAGDALSQARLQADLDAIIELGMFNPDRDRTYYRLEPGEGATRVVFHLTEYPKLTAVVYAGNRAMGTEALTQAVGDLLTPGEVYNLRLAQRAIDRIVEAYDAQGIEAIVSSARIDADGKLILSIVEPRLGKIVIDLVPPVTVDVQALREWIGIAEGALISRRTIADLSARLRKSGLFDQITVAPPAPTEDVSRLTLVVQGARRPWPRPNRQSISLLDPAKVIDSLNYYRPLPAETYTLELPTSEADLAASEAKAAASPGNVAAQLDVALAYRRVSEKRADAMADEIAQRCLGVLTGASPPEDRAAAARAMTLARRWREARIIAEPLAKLDDPTLRGATVLLETSTVLLALAATEGAGQTQPDVVSLEWAVTYLGEMVDVRKVAEAPVGREYARAVADTIEYLASLSADAVCRELTEFGRCALLLDVLAPLNAALGIDTAPKAPLTTGLSDRRVLAGLRKRTADPQDIEARYALARLLMMRALVASLAGRPTGRALGLDDEEAVVSAAEEASRIFEQLLDEQPVRFASVKEDIGTCLIVRGEIVQGRRWLYEAMADGAAREAVGLIFSTTRPENFLRTDRDGLSVEDARRQVYEEARAFAARLDPVPPAITELLAMSATWTGDYGVAEQAVGPLVAPGEETASGLAMRAYIALKQGDIDTAISSYEQAAALSAAPYIRDGLGLAYLAAGQADQALAQYESIPESWFDEFPI